MVLRNLFIKSHLTQMSNMAQGLLDWQIISLKISFTISVAILSNWICSSLSLGENDNKFWTCPIPPKIIFTLIIKIWSNNHINFQQNCLMIFLKTNHLFSPSAFDYSYKTHYFFNQKLIIKSIAQNVHHNT